jgi:hypothetical protein
MGNLPAFRRLMPIPMTTHDKTIEDAMQNNRSGERQLRTIEGTYIKPTAALGVMWAYRKGDMSGKGGRNGRRTGENGGESRKEYLNEMSD